MFSEINGCRVAWETVGNKGSKVVLLHGWGCDRKLMQPVADSLASDHQVLLLDFPGHGESTNPPEPWGVPEYGACLNALLTSLSWIPCAAVAHSFGGRIAAWLASEDTALFTRIVLTGAAGIRPTLSAEGQRRSAAFLRKKALAQQIGRAHV